MSTSRRVHEAVEASRGVADFTASEDPGHLRIAGSLSRDALSGWQALVDEQPAWLTVECTDEAQDRVDPREARAGERVRLSIRFNSPQGSAHLFTREGWRSFLYDDTAVSSVTVVRLAFIDTSFATKAFAVEPWLDAPETSVAQEAKADAGPRRQVRCQSPNLMAPTRIEPWVLVRPIVSAEPALMIWSDVATEMIARSLPNELYTDGGSARVSLSGQPPRRLDFGNIETNKIPFDVAQEAATWVYLEGADVEVRHTFLSAELAREWTPGASFSAGLASRLRAALDSARLVYKAHLRSGSKDTLKALAELRKSLGDEVQKLLQQARDLSSGVWRDVAVAIGVMAVRFAIDNTKAGTTTSGFAWIYLMVAIYISVSYAITITTNCRFLGIIEESRKAWRPKLYAFLDDEDYRTLADKPLSDALAAYRKTQSRTTVVVVLVIFALFLGVGIEMQWL